MAAEDGHHVAAYDATTGFILGLYLDNDGSTIPTPNTAVIDSDWAAIVANPTLVKIDIVTFQVVVRNLTDTELLVFLRAERNQRLRDSDWTMVSDLPILSGLKTSYATYRQALRDLPAAWVSDHNVAAPTLPTYVKV